MAASPDLLIIGHDSFGNSILLALASEHRGEVWFMLTDDDVRPTREPTPPLARSPRHAKLVADSFEQFMRSLRPLSA